MKNNLIFTGMPGSGKSTLGKAFSYEMGYNFIDFDDDILEKISMQTSEEILSILGLRSENIIPEDLAYTEVKDLLTRLGDDNFLELEGYLGENINFKEPTVLSTSGSLPLKLDAMNHLKKDGKVIYIDNPIEVILKRLSIMKTDRIIGMKDHTLEEILDYRKEFYDITKDYNFTVPDYPYETGISKEKIKMQQKVVFDAFMEFYTENKIGY